LGGEFDVGPSANAVDVIFAGDVGGTHSRLALFDHGTRRPAQLHIYPNADHGSLVELLDAFRADHPGDPVAATIGVAGPVEDGRTELVNLAWPVDAREVARALGLPEASVAVINDLEANAWGIAWLGRDDLVALNDADGEQEGNLALISAGTGLGQAFVTLGPHGEEVHASEGGHADFAPRTPLESELREWLAREGEHVSYERVCSGTGLTNVYEFLRGRSDGPEPKWLTKQRAQDGAAAITRAGLERRDPVASEALDLMVSISGAQAGNLALTVLATGGVYLGGGIAPKILPRLQEGAFLEAFTDKGRLAELVERIPVRVILNELTALLGAARHADQRAQPPRR
jgi:glucokinase